MPVGCDLLVVGGGVNGTGIARDAAGRGLSVVLCEQDDLASHTSSASTKLIHGGLRYLEEFHFALVRKALREREVLLAAAPHIMRPLHFVMPHAPHLRPAWMIRAGLFLYDHLAKRAHLAASSAIDLDQHIAGAPLKPGYRRGFVYSDGWVDDARLVVLNALDAQARGAAILTRTRCERLTAQGGAWSAQLRGAQGAFSISARAVVNASGPWVSDFVTRATPVQAAHEVRLVKGSHIVVPRLFEHRFAYIFQNEDRRIVFAIPYEGEFTLIGTTDEAWTAPPGPATISQGEIDYLLETVQRYFAVNIGPENVRWTYSGIRPLYDDHAANASAVTRDYVLDVDSENGAPPVLSVFGGKITTFRKLAEHALEKLAPHFPMAGPAWTAGAVLPGGDLPGGDFDAYVAELANERPGLPRPLLRRLARAYGTRTENILAGARTIEDLGRDFGGGLTEAELVYLARNEWAVTAHDVLWRRSKMGLHVLPQTADQVDAFYAGLPHG